MKSTVLVSAALDEWVQHCRDNQINQH